MNKVKCLLAVFAILLSACIAPPTPAPAPAATKQVIPIDLGGEFPKSEIEMGETIIQVVCTNGATYEFISGKMGETTSPIKATECEGLNVNGVQIGIVGTDKIYVPSCDSDDCNFQLVRPYGEDLSEDLRVEFWVMQITSDDGLVATVE